MKPVVSVCIPVFNGGPFIAKAIEPVLAQTITCRANKLTAVEYCHIFETE